MQRSDDAGQTARTGDTSTVHKRATVPGDLRYWTDQVEGALDRADLDGIVSVDVDALEVCIGLHGSTSSAAHRQLAEGLDERGFEVVSEPGEVPVRIDPTAERLDEPVVEGLS